MLARGLQIITFPCPTKENEMGSPLSEVGTLLFCKLLLIFEFKASSLPFLARVIYFLLGR